MSGLFGSTTIKGTRITDFAQTSANVGQPIPFLYGRAPVNGNVIFAALPPKETRNVQRQGKGGVKQETFTYSTSYAIAFCRGPILGYWWIKRNGKVVYSQDPNAPIEDQAYAAKWAAKVMMYNGTMDQLPNSTIESYKGSGRVSAFRGLSYVVLPNEDVTEGGGAIPSYEAVPIASPAEVWITSKPYAQIARDSVNTGARLAEVTLLDFLKTATASGSEAVPTFRPTGGQMFEVVPPEHIDFVTLGFAPTAGELKPPPSGDAKEASVPSFAPTNGVLAIPPLGNLQKDEVVLGFGPTGGQLVTVISDNVSNLPFEGENGSSTIIDLTGRSWTVAAGVKLSTALYAADSTSSARFDGTSSAYMQSVGSGFDFSGDLTCAYDVYYDEAIGATTYILCVDGLDATHVGNCIGRTSTGKLFVQLQRPGPWYNYTTILSTNVLTSGVWHRVRIEKENLTVRLYINGVLDASSTLPNQALGNQGRTAFFGKYYHANIPKTLLGNVDNFKFDLFVASP